ncbi:MAG TPA: hypothetical protein VK437_06495 [Steroidobacteraceae bacterium]|nr:hypothetical protein [Steroidobacteraceae bacterium]
MSKLLAALLPLALLSLASVAAQAADGVVLIDQATVLASGGFPYVINTAGSYRLESNLTATASDAIHIVTGDVTLDLNGFTITGPGTISGATGISDAGTAHSGVSILNGNLAQWSFAIALESCSGCSVERVQATHIVNGINMGFGALVKENRLTGPGGFLEQGNSPRFGNGIVTNNNALVTENIVSGFGTGISVVLFSTISGNTASSNVIGIEVGCPSNLVGNTAVFETLGGVQENGSGCTRYNNNL